MDRLGGPEGLRWFASAYECHAVSGKRQVIGPDNCRDLLVDNRYFPDCLAATARGYGLHTCSIVVEAGLLAEVGGFRPELHSGEDLDLWWRIALREPAIGYSDRPGFSYLRREGSLSNLYHASYAERILDILGRLEDLAGQQGEKTLLRIRPHLRGKYMVCLKTSISTGQKRVLLRTLRQARGLLTAPWRLFGWLMVLVPACLTRWAIRAVRRCRVGRSAK